jgi:hypothetical protein
VGIIVWHGRRKSMGDMDYENTMKFGELLDRKISGAACMVIEIGGKDFEILEISENDLLNYQSSGVLTLKVGRQISE